MDVKTSYEHDTETRTKTAIFGGIGAGKSFVVNSILGQECVKEERISRDVAKQNEYITGNLKGSPVLLIDTPGLDGQGLAFSKVNANLESNLIERIDKAVIVIKRLEPTESEEIQNVLKSLNYKDHPANFCFVINDEEEMQTKEKNKTTKARTCMALLGIDDYEYLGDIQNCNSSKVLYIPNKNDPYFASQIEKLQAFTCKESEVQIRIKTSRKLWRMEQKAWSIMMIFFILLLGIVALRSELDLKNYNQQGMTEVMERPMSEDSDLQIENLMIRKENHENILKEKDREYKTNLGGLEEDLKKTVEEKERLEKVQNDQKSQIEELQSKNINFVTTKDEDIKGLKEDHKKNIELNIKNHKEDIEGLKKSQIEEIQKLNAEYKTNLEGLEEDLKKTVEEKERHEKVQNDQKSQIEELQSKNIECLTTKDEDIKGLKEDHKKNIELNKKNHNEEIKKMQSEIETLKAKKTEDLEIKGLKESIGTNKKKLKEIKEQTFLGRILVLLVDPEVETEEKNKKEEIKKLQSENDKIVQRIDRLKDLGTMIEIVWWLTLFFLFCLYLIYDNKEKIMQGLGHMFRDQRRTQTGVGNEFSDDDEEQGSSSGNSREANTPSSVATTLAPTSVATMNGNEHMTEESSEDETDKTEIPEKKEIDSGDKQQTPEMKTKLQLQDEARLVMEEARQTPLKDNAKELELDGEPDEAHPISEETKLAPMFVGQQPTATKLKLPATKSRLMARTKSARKQK